MRIAVTGSSGHLGRAVVAAASAAGHTVVGIDRVDDMPTTAAILDLLDFDAIAATIDGCDALVHLAAITGPGHQPDHVVHNNNVVASYNALRAAAEVGIGRVCQASSINAIGGRFSRHPRYDYFPLDEQHPGYAEDPYSLSKATCELQADTIARRFGTSIASLRLHGIVDDRRDAERWTALPPDVVARQLWGYTRLDAAVDACLAAVDADLGGHEAFYVVAPDTMADQPSADLAHRWYPTVPIRTRLSGDDGFFDCSKAHRLLGWQHPRGAATREEDRT
jgi:nucleoside-diphosphate-sugar epimerase